MDISELNENDVRRLFARLKPLVVLASTMETSSLSSPSPGFEVVLAATRASATDLKLAEDLLTELFRSQSGRPYAPGYTFNVRLQEYDKGRSARHILYAITRSGNGGDPAPEDYTSIVQYVRPRFKRVGSVDATIKRHDGKHVATFVTVTVVNGASLDMLSLEQLQGVSDNIGRFRLGLGNRSLVVSLEHPVVDGDLDTPAIKVAEELVAYLGLFLKGPALTAAHESGRVQDPDMRLVPAFDFTPAS